MSATHLSGNDPGQGFVSLELHGGAIARVVCEGQERENAPILSPGLVDLQVNGFAGIDFSAPDLEPQTAISVLAHQWRTGVTSFCPTLITNSRAVLTRNFRVLEAARRQDEQFARTVPCYHLEGPYLSPGGSKGVHDPQWMHAPDWSEFSEWQDAAGGNIGIVTLAPELPGAIDFIARARDAGIVVALGHTDAVPEQIHAAVDAGARLSTHLGNGIAQTIDRHGNPLWAQLTRGELSASIICDGFHLPHDLVKVMVRMKGIERCILITDAVHVATLVPGHYSIVGTDIELRSDGKVVKADGACLAGSALSMNRAVTVFMRQSGATLADALQAATRNPAALLARPGVCSEIAVGQPANVLLSRTGRDGLAVEKTWLAGVEVYREIQ